jgi:hypothetical protein
MWTEEQREALEEFYREQDVSKLDNIEKILESFSPAELEASLESKYGCSPALRSSSVSFQDDDDEEVAALDLPQENFETRRRVSTNAHGTPFESDSIYETIKTLSCVGSGFSILVGSLNFGSCMALSASVSRLDKVIGYSELVPMGYILAMFALLWGLFGVYLLCHNSKKLTQIETILEAEQRQDPNLFHKLQEYHDDTTHYESESEALGEAFVSFAEKIKKDTKRATLVGTVGQAILFAFFGLLVIMVFASVDCFDETTAKETSATYRTSCDISRAKMLKHPHYSCFEKCSDDMSFVVTYHGVIVLVLGMGFTYIGLSVHRCLTAAVDNGLVDVFPVRVGDNARFEPYSEAIAAAEAAAGGPAVRTTSPRTVAGSTSSGVALSTVSGSAVVI